MPIVAAELIQVTEEAKRRFTEGCDPRVLGIREWFVRGGNYFVIENTQERIRVTPIDRSWSEANGADCIRYLWAARESIIPRSATVYDPRSIGWASISAYYSGFYLMLGLLRIFGQGLLYLDSEDCDALSVAPGATTRLDRGTYALVLNIGSVTTLELKKKNVRGFHEGFWRHSDDCLRSVADEIGSGNGIAVPFSQSVRAAALLSLEGLREWLGMAGSPDRDVGWMCSLRNDINYRLTREVWGPRYYERGVSVDRLRQDMFSILRGNSDRLGAHLIIDSDIRAMIERVCVLFRGFSKLTNFPPLR